MSEKKHLPSPSKAFLGFIWIYVTKEKHFRNTRSIEGKFHGISVCVCVCVCVCVLCVCVCCVFFNHFDKFPTPPPRKGILHKLQNLASGHDGQRSPKTVDLILTCFQGAAHQSLDRTRINSAPFARCLARGNLPWSPWFEGESKMNVTWLPVACGLRSVMACLIQTSKSGNLGESWCR